MRPNHYSPDVDAKNDRILTEIVNAVVPQPPTYMIRQITEHCWVLWKWNTMEQLYEYPFPVAGHCRSEAEAIAWMEADAERRMPDTSKMEPLIYDAPSRYYDADGKPVERPPLSSRR
jgi:hypothetical protein